MIRITFEAKNYISLCEELKLFLSYSNIPTTKEPPTAPVVPTSVSVPTTPEPTQAPPTPAVPVAPVKEYTLEEIQVALQPLMDAGRTNEIVGLMQKYKVASLPELPKDQFPNLVVDLRNMGARI